MLLNDKGPALCVLLLKFLFFGVAAAAAVLLLCVATEFGLISVPRVAAEFTTPGGEKVVVVKTFSGTFEPYRLDFFFTTGPAGGWSWQYLDHQAALGLVKLELSESGRLIVVADWESRAEFDLRSHEYRLLGEQREAQDISSVYSGSALTRMTSLLQAL